VRASVDKSVVRELLGELGLPCCRWVGGDDPVALAARATDLRFPVVVKPADAQGGRGVARCADPAEVDGAMWEAKRYSYSGRLMIEEEVEGEHCSCECVVDDGRVAFLALTRMELSPRPMTMTMAHVMPAAPGDGVEAEIRSSLDRLCARLGYRRGPLNADVVITPDGVPYIIEIGLRTGGNGLDALVRQCYGVDPVRAALLAAVGAPADLAPHPPRPVSWRVLTAPHAGELVSISGTEKVAAMPEVGELVVLARPGQRVRPYLEVSDRLGWVVLRADTRAALDAAGRAVAAALRVDVALVDEPEPVSVLTLPVPDAIEQASARPAGQP
jgi:biotin carboxylase